MAKVEKTVEAYLAAQPAPRRKVLQQVRRLIKTLLPKAREVISYGIPAYKVPEGTVVFFAGWKEHVSLYPLGTLVPEKLAKPLAKYEQSKGTVRFPLSEPMPLKLIERIVKLRLQEVLARSKE